MQNATTLSRQRHPHDAARGSTGSADAASPRPPHLLPSSLPIRSIFHKKLHGGGRRAMARRGAWRPRRKKASSPSVEGDAADGGPRDRGPPRRSRLSSTSTTARSPAARGTPAADGPVRLCSASTASPPTSPRSSAASSRDQRQVAMVARRGPRSEVRSTRSARVSMRASSSRCPTRNLIPIAPPPLPRRLLRCVRSLTQSSLVIRFRDAALLVKKCYRLLAVTIDRFLSLIEQ